MEPAKIANLELCPTTFRDNVLNKKYVVIEKSNKQSTYILVPIAANYVLNTQHPSMTILIVDKSFACKIK